MYFRNKNLFIPVFLIFTVPSQAQYDGYYDTRRVPYRVSNNKFIFVDSATMSPLSGKQWEDVYWFDTLSGYGQVKQKGSWGIVNSKEEFVIPPQYDFVDVVNGTIILQKENEYYIKDTQRKDLIPAEWKIHKVSYHPFGYFWLYRSQGRDTLCALMNRSGKILIPFGRFEEISGYPWLGYLAVKKNGLWGLSDTLGNQLNECKYEVLFFDDIDTHGIIVQLNGKTGFIKKTGEVDIPIVYDEARYFFEGLAAVKKDGKWGYVDRQNELILPFRFSVAKDFKEGSALVSEDGSGYGFINTKGDWVIPPKFDYLSVNSNNRIIYRERQLYGVMDTKGNRITKPLYNDAKPYSEGLSLVSKYSRGFELWGFIDTNGVVAIPFQDYLRRSFTERFGAFAGDKYARRCDSFHLGFSGIITRTYSGQKIVETRLEYYIDRAGRKYSEKEN